MRRTNIGWRHTHAKAERMPRHGPLELRMRGRRRGAVHQDIGLLPQQAMGQPVERSRIKQAGRGHGAAQVQWQGAGAAGLLQKARNTFVDASEDARVPGQWLTQVRLTRPGQRHATRLPHKVTHPFPGLHTPLGFELAQHLQRRGQAHLVPLAQLAHRRHAHAGCEAACGDRLLIQGRQLAVDRDFPGLGGT